MRVRRERAAVREEVDELEFAKLEFQIAAAELQGCAVGSGPFNGREEVTGALELVQDVVHVCELLSEAFGFQGVDAEISLKCVVGVRRCAEGKVGVDGMQGLGMGGSICEKGRGHGELTFAEEVHGDCAVDQGVVG